MPSTKPATKTAARRQRSSGKTSPASSTTAATPSGISWEHWPEKAVRSNRQGKNGRTQVVCLDPGAASPGACSMLNISASPNGAVACFLWQVVEVASIPPRYFLSAQACAGILRRASRRGKTLPALLDRALRQQAGILDMQD